MVDTASVTRAAVAAYIIVLAAYCGSAPVKAHPVGVVVFGGSIVVINLQIGLRFVACAYSAAVEHKSVVAIPGVSAEPDGVGKEYRRKHALVVHKRLRFHSRHRFGHDYVFNGFCIERVLADYGHGVSPDIVRNDKRARRKRVIFVRRRVIEGVRGIEAARRRRIVIGELVGNSV